MPGLEVLHVGEGHQTFEPLGRASGHRLGQVPDVVAEVKAFLAARLDARLPQDPRLRRIYDQAADKLHVKT